MRGMLRRVRVRLHGREIGVGAPAGLARFLSCDPKNGRDARMRWARFLSCVSKIDIRARLRLVRVRPRERGSGGRSCLAQQNGAGGCEDRVAGAEEAAVAGPTGDNRAAPEPDRLRRAGYSATPRSAAALVLAVWGYSHVRARA